MEDKTKDLDDLELAAYNYDEMPKGLNLYEQCYFLCLRALYGDYRYGRIDLQEASAEKQRLRAEFFNQTKLEEARTAAYREMTANILDSEQIRIDCLKGGDDIKTLTKALVKYVSDISGDKCFYTSMVRKWGLE